MKELKQEFLLITENPELILLLLTIIGILPAICCGILFKIFGL